MGTMMYHCERRNKGRGRGGKTQDLSNHANKESAGGAKGFQGTYVFVQERLLLLLRHRCRVDFGVEVDVLHDHGFGPKHLDRDRLRNVRFCYFHHRLQRHRRRDLARNVVTRVLRGQT